MHIDKIGDVIENVTVVKYVHEVPIFLIFRNSE
jgi:hypothetical protein